MPLTNCEVSFISTWSENCLLTNKAYGEAVTGNNPVLGINAPIGATFKITGTRLNIPAVTLSTEIDNKLLEQLKTEFKRTIKWNKYRLEMSKHTKDNNLSYLINPKFTTVNRLFVLSFDN